MLETSDANQNQRLAVIEQQLGITTETANAATTQLVAVQAEQKSLRDRIGSVISKAASSDVVKAELEAFKNEAAIRFAESEGEDATIRERLKGAIVGAAEARKEDVNLAALKRLGEKKDDSINWLIAIVGGGIASVLGLSTMQTFILNRGLNRLARRRASQARQGSTDE